MTRAYAPATLANLIVGFDVLGLAAEPIEGSLWGDVVIVDDAPDYPGGFRLSTRGPYSGQLPTEPRENLVHALTLRFLETVRTRQGSTWPVRLTLEKNLPVSSGLGSSASSAVATLVALNHHFGFPLSDADLLPLAGWAEGLTSGAEHFDNVAPALFGGVCLLRGGGLEGVVKLPWPRDWVLVFVSPEAEIQTRQARAVLPASIALRDAVRYWGNLALFVTALYRSDRELAAGCLVDHLIEPPRSALLPGFRAAQAEARAAGALGCSFSGSGPTTFALAPDRAAAPEIGRRMVEAFGRAGIRATVRVARPDERGARTLDADPGEEAF